MIKQFFLAGLIVSSAGIIAADGNETKNGKRVYAPIKHQKYYQNEKELFGYNPKFKPGTISFDLKNRPYIISDDEKDPSIQTLDENGKWIKLDFASAIRKKYPKWNGYVKLDAFGNRRISFDKDGDAYLLLGTGRSNLHRMLLLHSKDNCRTWTVYQMPYLEFGSIEVNDTFNMKKYPPALIFYSIRNRPKGEFVVILPEKKADGTLRFSKPVIIAKDSATCPPHSGDGNFLVSVGDKVHVIWTVNKSVNKMGNTHYAATYDRKTGKVSKPFMVGVSNTYIDKVDNHCLPVITVDSKGYLHAILGTHHHPSTYVRSLKPDSVEGWTKGVEFGVKKKKTREGSYTYPSINCDKWDNIHVVSRWAGWGYRFTLAYNKKTSDGKWLPQQILVMPFRAMYGCWYHKVSIDRKSRLFVYYINYLNQLDKASLKAYHQKWPEDKINLNPGKGRWDRNIKPHNPAILMSDDAGEKWFLAVTGDFINGFETSGK